jgi:hypothetical protein
MIDGHLAVSEMPRDHHPREGSGGAAGQRQSSTSQLNKKMFRQIAPAQMCISFNVEASLYAEPARAIRCGPALGELHVLTTGEALTRVVLTGSPVSVVFHFSSIFETLVQSPEEAPPRKVWTRLRKSADGPSLGQSSRHAKKAISAESQARVRYACRACE